MKLSLQGTNCKPFEKHPELSNVSTTGERVWFSFQVNGNTWHTHSGDHFAVVQVMWCLSLSANIGGNVYYFNPLVLKLLWRRSLEEVNKCTAHILYIWRCADDWSAFYLDFLFIKFVLGSIWRPFLMTSLLTLSSLFGYTCWFGILMIVLLWNVFSSSFYGGYVHRRHTGLFEIN